jgi:hypothetical protein
VSRSLEPAAVVWVESRDSIKSHTTNGISFLATWASKSSLMLRGFQGLEDTSRMKNCPRTLF